MEYKEIVSVTGEPGLFQLLTSKSDGAIVRSLDGQVTKFVPSRNHNFTPLESIEVFTTGENVPLSEIFKAMNAGEPSTPVIDAGKDSVAIKQYFGQIYPALDEGRVYMSDMKKMLKWYPLLKANDLLKFEEEAADTTAEVSGAEKGLQEEKKPEEEKVAPKEKKRRTATDAASTGTKESKETKKKQSAVKKSPVKKAKQGDQE